MGKTINYGFNLIEYNDEVIPDKVNENFITLDTALQGWLQDVSRRINEMGYREYSARMINVEQEVEQIEGTGNGSIKKAVAELKDLVDAADASLSGRLDTLEGDGDGSVKKAVKDVADKEASDISAVNERIDAIVGSGEGSIDDRIEKMKAEILGGADESYDTLEKLYQLFHDAGTITGIDFTLSDEFIEEWKDK